jgi:nucleoside diphosphate kinase
MRRGGRVTVVVRVVMVVRGGMLVLVVRVKGGGTVDMGLSAVPGALRGAFETNGPANVAAKSSACSARMHPLGIGPGAQ